MLSPRGHSIRTAGLSLLFVVKDVLHVLTVIRKCTFVLFRSGHLGCHSNSAQQEDSKLHTASPSHINQPRWLLPLAYGGLGDHLLSHPTEGAYILGYLTIENSWHDSWTLRPNERRTIDVEDLVFRSICLFCNFICKMIWSTIIWRSWVFYWFQTLFFVLQ